MNLLSNLGSDFLIGGLERMMWTLVPPCPNEFTATYLFSSLHCEEEEEEPSSFVGMDKDDCFISPTTGFHLFQWIPSATRKPNNLFSWARRAACETFGRVARVR